MAYRWYNGWFIKDSEYFEMNSYETYFGLIDLVSQIAALLVPAIGLSTLGYIIGKGIGIIIGLILGGVIGCIFHGILSKIFYYLIIASLIIILISGIGIFLYAIATTIK